MSKFNYHFQSKLDMTLERFRSNTTIDEIKKDLKKQWILRYGLFECIQVVIDISCHLVAQYNLGNPKTYVECVELLNEFDYIDKRVTGNIISMIGLRNLLIHEYSNINIAKLYHLLDNLDDFSDFAHQVKGYLK